MENKLDIKRLPLHLFFPNLPAIPFDLKETAITLIKLIGRAQETKQAQIGLSNEYTIKGKTANAYSFLYGGKAMDHRESELKRLQSELMQSNDSILKNIDLVINKLKLDENDCDPEDSLTHLSLDQASQYSISWSSYGNTHRDASKELLSHWASSLTNAQEATKQFFPNIASFGIAYNLMITQKVTAKNIQKLKADYKEHWSEKVNQLYEKGLLYVIDMSIYKMLKVNTVNNSERFTPASFIWLEQDPNTLELTPFAIHISGKDNTNATFFELGKCTDSAWVYALQAAKTSVTVFGIWSGHVYQWHIVTAAMIQSMFDNINSQHPIYKLLAPQSSSLIGFDNVLLLLWKEIAPPTSIATSFEFLELSNAYAKNRDFFDDDPANTLESLGISEKDFSLNTPWDKYPIIAYALDVWRIVSEYANQFVDNTYSNDQDIINDQELQNWIKSCGDKKEGNMQGLPSMNSKANLKSVLTSFLYRISIHGISRMENTANPALTFVGNFPPCLQKSEIPNPNDEISANELLEYLPNTGTIGQMVTFYYTFIYSAPYNSLLPVKGIQDQLFFGEDPQSPNNIALLQFRASMKEFMNAYTQNSNLKSMPVSETQIHQWPMDIET
ncbi:lipoxygenase family protein [Aureibacter tunicatorum]|uniref:Lipoxygenase domain-containing protein n=1 Tax=Aureibacter tunicatorum TaxID=866807 RepID=A0AAE3XSW0_9BACT|nr:lipoxygenase family protein [Aureibacter tunicatorum]MDR6241395.1 hypothetical protein [Aureibacter tunicatorum]BDD06760.1 hypothetical protein AUTU_42430 [Aureibacter tunicatorum]